MTLELKTGDRVRVNAERPVRGYQPGSKGIVSSGPTTDKFGKSYYVLSMDKDSSDDGTVFRSDEIELDV